MQRDPRAYLWDVVDAAQSIQSFTQGMDALSYRPSLQSTTQSMLSELGTD